MPEGLRQHQVNELPVVAQSSFETQELFTPDGLFHRHPEIKAETRQIEIATLAFELQNLIVEAREKRKDILGNIRLTVDGKREKLDEYFRELVGKVGARIDVYLNRSELEGVRSRSNQLNLRRLELPAYFKSEISTGAAERETRDELRSMPDIQRKQLLIEAAEEDDRITLRAFQFAPPRFPLVDAKALQEAGWLHARRRFPEQVEDIEDAERLLSVLRSNLEKALQVLHDLAAAGTQEVADMLRPGKVIPAQVDDEGNPFLDPTIARPIS